MSETERAEFLEAARRLQLAKDLLWIEDKIEARDGTARSTTLFNVITELRQYVGDRPLCCGGGPQWGHAMNCPKAPD